MNEDHNDRLLEVGIPAEWILAEPLSSYDEDNLNLVIEMLEEMRDLGVPKELMKSAAIQSMDIDLLTNLLTALRFLCQERKGFYGNNKPYNKGLYKPVQIKYDWQLAALTGTISEDVDVNYRDERGSYFAHYIAWSGSAKGIQALIDGYPDHAAIKDRAQRTIAHYAAMSSNPAGLRHLLRYHAALTTQKLWNIDVEQKTPANHPENQVLDDMVRQALIRIGNNVYLNLEPDLLEADIDLLVHFFKPGEDGVGLFHIIGAAGNHAALTMLDAKGKTAIINAKDTDGETLVHHALRNQKIGFIIELLTEHPDRLRDTWVTNGEGIPPEALDSTLLLPGIVKNLIDISRDRIRATPNADRLGHEIDVDVLIALREDFDYQTGKGLAHWLSEGGDPVLFAQILEKVPSLMKRSWIEDKKGHSPQDLAPEMMKPGPNEILYRHLREASESMVEGNPIHSNQVALLLEFKEKCQAKGFIPYAIQRLDFKKLTPNILLHALMLVPKKTNFIHQLEHFMKHTAPGEIDEEDGGRARTLTAKETSCLKLILNDYINGLLLPKSHLDDQIIAKIKSSEIFKRLEVVKEPLEKKQLTFNEHLAVFKERVKALPNSPAKTYVTDVFTLGIEDMMTHSKERVIQSMIRSAQTRYDNVIGMNGGMVIHTDHVFRYMERENVHEIGVAELRRRSEEVWKGIFDSLFLAADVAFNKGQFDDFCQMINSGFCYESRTRGPIDKYAKMAEELEYQPETFEALMEQYETREFRPYYEIMLGRDACNILPWALDFIEKRHKGVVCVHDENYAPNGIIEAQYVRKYLEEDQHYVNTHEIPPEVYPAYLEEEKNNNPNRGHQNPKDEPDDEVDVNHFEDHVADDINPEVSRLLNGVNFNEFINQLIDKHKEKTMHHQDEKRIALEELLVSLIQAKRRFHQGAEPMFRKVYNFEEACHNAIYRANPVIVKDDSIAKILLAILLCLAGIGLVAVPLMYQSGFFKTKTQVLVESFEDRIRFNLHA